MAPFPQAVPPNSFPYLPSFQLSLATALANCYAFATFATFTAFATQLEITIHLFFADSQIKTSRTTHIDILKRYSLQTEGNFIPTSIANNKFLGFTFTTIAV